MLSIHTERAPVTQGDEPGGRWQIIRVGVATHLRCAPPLRSNIDRNSPFLPFWGQFQLHFRWMTLFQYSNRFNSTRNRFRTLDCPVKPASKILLRPKLTEIAHFCRFWASFSFIFAKWHFSNIPFASTPLAIDSEHSIAQSNLHPISSYDQNWPK